MSPHVGKIAPDTAAEHGALEGLVEAPKHRPVVRVLRRGYAGDVPAWGSSMSRTLPAGRSPSRLGHRRPLPAAWSRKWETSAGSWPCSSATGSSTARPSATWTWSSGSPPTCYRSGWKGVRRWAKADIRRVYYTLLIVFFAFGGLRFVNITLPIIIFAVSANIANFTMALSAILPSGYSRSSCRRGTAAARSGWWCWS